MTFKEYPQRQKAASFNLDEVLEKLKESSRVEVGSGHQGRAVRRLAAWRPAIARWQTTARSTMDGRSCNLTTKFCIALASP
ncbi:MAG: hypothetical protein MZU95_12010 [Desulfomicrobium escambiense]|nr:hypothetical protein [Desulfomicrobium escambiense]